MKKSTNLFCVLFFLFNVTSSGQITFQKTYGAAFGGQVGHTVLQTVEGGYIISGFTDIFGAGGNEIYLIKTDANGNLQWTKTYGGIDHDSDGSVQQTSDSGYIIIGRTISFGSGNSDIYLIKTDVNGNVIWSKTFGGTNNDVGMDVQQTSDGGFIVTGGSQGSGTGPMDSFLIKTDANGDTLWTKSYSTLNSGYGSSVRQTSDGGYIICGAANSFGLGSNDVYLFKTDVDGNLTWSKTFGGSSDDYGCSVRQTTNGGYVICGYTYLGAGNYDCYLIATDSNGDTLWTKAYGGPLEDRGLSAEQTSDGGFILTGYYSPVWQNIKLYLIKTNFTGDLIWSKAYGGSVESGQSLKQTSDMGYIITGASASFSFGYNNVYLVKTDSLGNSGCYDSVITTIVTSPPTQVTNVTTLISSTNFIITSAPTIVGNGGTSATFCTSAGINELTTNNSFSIFPNPSSGNLIISFEGTIIKGNVEILNILGENVYSENIFNKSKEEINLKNISEGIYFVKVFDGEKNYCKKLIVE
jgi:hypothetical protein